MAEDKGKGSGGSKPKAQPKEPPPRPKGEIEAPGFKWVTKGEKGSGVEPAVQVGNESE